MQTNQVFFRLEFLIEKRVFDFNEPILRATELYLAIGIFTIDGQVAPEIRGHSPRFRLI